MKPEKATEAPRNGRVFFALFDTCILHVAPVCCLQFDGSILPRSTSILDAWKISQHC